MKIIKNILIVLIALFPFFAYAETCDFEKISIESVNVFDSNGNSVENLKPTITDKRINLNLNMVDVGDNIVYKIIIKNDSNDNYELNKDSFNISTEHIKYSFLLEDDSVTIEENSTKTIYLKIEYNNRVSYEQFNNNEYVDNKEISIDLLSSNNLINPKTGVASISLIGLCIVGICLVNYFAINKKKKIVLTVILMVAFIIPMFISASCSYSIKVDSNINVKKITEFDVGRVLNSKMSAIKTSYIVSFKRSDSLPDSIRERADEELRLAQSVSVSDEDVNNEYERIINETDHYEGYQINENDNVNYIFKVEDDFTFSISKVNLIHDLTYRTVVVLENGNNNTYLILDDYDIKIATLEEVKAKIKEKMYEDKWQILTPHILSSPYSAYPIYVWYNSEDNSIYYYSESEEIFLNKNSSSIFSGFSSLGSAPGVEQLNTSRVILMRDMFYECSLYNSEFDLDLHNWNTSNVIDMSYMFAVPGDDREHANILWRVGNLSNWDTSKVQSMEGMFYEAGFKVDSFVIEGLSNWNTSSVTNMRSMFASTGNNCTSWSVGDLSAWDTSKVTDMSYMFSGGGLGAEKWNLGDLSAWNTSSVTNMRSMFASTGNNCTSWSVGDLSAWDTSKVTDMSYMFAATGSRSIVWDVGDISKWNTSNVTRMDSMFHNAAKNSRVRTLDLSAWDTSKVINMQSMFYCFAESSSINLTISNWDTRNVKNMDSMFSCTGNSASSLNINLDIYAGSISRLFDRTYSVNGIINIYNKPERCERVFENSSIEDGSSIIVNYKISVDNIDDIINTKSQSSHVYKGSIIE